MTSDILPFAKISSVVILEKLPVYVFAICQFLLVSDQRISAFTPPPVGLYKPKEPLTDATNAVPIVNTFEAYTVVPLIIRFPPVCMSPDVTIFPPT